jgi:hypothetical protein
MSTAVACLALVGCVDPKGSFNDFGTRVVDGGAGAPDRPNLTTIPDITGHWFIVMRPNLSEDRFLKMVADFTMTANPDGTAKYSSSIVGLRTADGMPSTMQPPITNTDIAIELNGTFTGPLVGTFPGDCNTVIPGSNAALNGALIGEIHSTDLFCGTLTGTAGSLPLGGSTFAAQRIPAGTVGADLPAIVFKCPDTTPDAGI